MTSPSIINSNTVSGLVNNFTFALIPDCPAATAAGYTQATRDAAQIWYPPIVDGDNFYYAAWNGNNTAPTHLSTILCCRKCIDGSLVWATNCADYDLDVAPNVLGDTSTVIRAQLFILDGTLYCTRSNVCNIGPQLYAVDKINGNLKWAIAYYTPDGAPPYITTKGNYAVFTGSNMRLGDLAVTADYFTVDGVTKKYVFVGSSSLQNNWNLNYYVSGFPKYTDQGFLFCIEDQETTAVPVWSTPTCAPSLKVGDVIVKGGAPAYDPFQPTQDIVAFESISTVANYFDQPYFLDTPPSPAMPNTTPVATIVNFDKSTVISASLIQPLWGLVGYTIYQDSDRSTPYNLSGILAAWNVEQTNLPTGGSARHIIWSYVNASTLTTIQGQTGNVNVMYFKYMTSGQTITESYDAQSLNYWGNGVWGAQPKIDKVRNIIHFGVGQAHNVPLSEDLFYQEPSNNFFVLKTPVVDAVNAYIVNQTPPNLNRVKRAKRTFLTLISDLALNTDDKSPRGRMSYSDAIMGAYITPYTTNKGVLVPGGTKAYGIRIVPHDSFTFLSQAPIVNVYPLNVLDGDASSGVKLFDVSDCDDKGVFVSVSPKSGLIPIVDITNINPDVQFDDNNLNRKGVFLHKLVFGGPNSSGGGSTYQTSVELNNLISTQSNLSFLSDGARGTNGQFESHVTEDGRIFYPGDGFAESVAIPSGRLIWEQDFGEYINSEVVVRNGVAYFACFSGMIRALSTDTGAALWSFNGNTIGMNGGQVGPAVTDTQTIWTNACYAFGNGVASPNGASFVLPA